MMNNDTMLVGEADEVKIERAITLPDAQDKSRPAPIDVLLVDGPMDGKLMQCPVEATHVSFWVYKDGRLAQPHDFDTNKTEQVRYQIHPLIGNTQTWYIGRLLGTRFDAAIEAIVQHYRKG